MTVSELISQLKKYPLNMNVVVYSEQLNVQYVTETIIEEYKEYGKVIFISSDDSINKCTPFNSNDIGI
jgi:hypothetical protein